MAMGSAETKRKNQYIKENYDQLKIVVPKGMKDVIARYASQKNMSMTEYLTGLIKKNMGYWQENPNIGELEYDHLNLLLPKGMRATITKYAERKNLSVTAYIIDLIDKDADG
jgi:hypothetical protein